MRIKLKVIIIYGGHYILPVQTFVVCTLTSKLSIFLDIRDSFYLKIPQEFPEFQNVSSFLR